MQEEPRSTRLPLLELRDVRLAKVALLRARGINPYPSSCERTHLANDILTRFAELENTRVTVAGRLMSWREQGSLVFGHVQDPSAKIQLFISRQHLKPGGKALGFDDLKLLDVGDFVQAAGTVTKTKRGEISVLTDSLMVIAKSIRPLPDKWHGLSDPDAILRRRYLDTTMNPEQKGTFETVSRILLATRRFLDAEGFVEFHTPVIQPQYGGGTARPFVTHVNALDCDMYLAISHELYLKRLIAAGFEKVYTIGRYFRNEGIDRVHHPEFAMIETMAAYQNYLYSMDLVERLFVFIAREAFGRTQIKVGGETIDLAEPWRRVSMADCVEEHTGIDFRQFKSVNEANAALGSLGVTTPQPTVGQALSLAFEERVASKLRAPTLLFGQPVEISPLAKPMEDDPRFAERFEIFIGGIEVGDNWSEQNDPEYLHKVWREMYDPQLLARGECHPPDYDFLEMLEHGMPPTTGIGPGIERMAMLFLEKDRIDDVNYFPLMRPHLSEANRIVFNVEEGCATPVISDTAVLALDDLDELIRAGCFGPQPVLHARPILTGWTSEGQSTPRKLTGHVQLRALLHNVAVLIGGYSARPEQPGDTRAMVDAFSRWCEESLKTRFPKAQIQIEPVLYAVADTSAAVR